MILTETKKLSRDEWLRYRKTGIGGSDAAAVCGLDPYRSAIDVWSEKTDHFKKEDRDNESLRVGRDLEDYVAQRFAEATGKKVRRRNAIFQNDEYPFMIANVDRMVVGENALLECKTANAYARDKWADGKIPESYEIQCHHYMAVTGTEKVYLACLIMGIDFVVREIERDEEVIKALRNIEENFWHTFVETGEMPPPDGSKSAGDVIKNLYPESDDGMEVDLSEFGDVLNRYDEISALIDDLSREKDEIIQSIQNTMKSAEIGYIGARKVSWKSAKPRQTIDSKKMKAEKPDVYQAYLKTGAPTRRFTIAKKKEDEE